MNLGPLEVIVIFVVALLVFGPNKLPEMGRQVGKAVREFRKFQSSFNNEFRDFIDEPSSSSQRPPQQQQLTRADGEGQAGGSASSSSTASTSTSTPAPGGPGPAADSGPAVPLRPAGGDEERGSGNGDGSADPSAKA